MGIGVSLMAGCTNTDSAGALVASQRVVIEGCDWGPAVTKTILTLGEPVDASSVSPAGFRVTQTHEPSGVRLGDSHQTASVERPVLEAYPCNEEGERTADGQTRHIALELGYGPELGSPFRYDFATSQVSWCDPYELEVALAQGSELALSSGGRVCELDASPAVDLDEALMPQLAGVDLTGSFTGGDDRTLAYASFLPDDDGKSHPLVIWLHGAGEGGTDPRITVLGNKVTALFGAEFQEAMGGAYVLCPQTPQFWMVYDEQGDWTDNPGTDSVYLETLKELIDSFVAEHPRIDQSRIYVGGCSNGGFMTVDLLVNHPGYFAAAYPICEAYAADGLDDARLAALAQTPVWFTWARNDTTVDPARYEEPTVERLRGLGADVHVSVFDDVHDTSGLYAGADGGPYQYQGHFSWIYFFNNQCAENGVRLWDWLARQHL